MLRWPRSPTSESIRGPRTIPVVRYQWSGVCSPHACSSFRRRGARRGLRRSRRAGLGRQSVSGERARCLRAPAPRVDAAAVRRPGFAGGAADACRSGSRLRCTSTCASSRAYSCSAASRSVWSRRARRLATRRSSGPARRSPATPTTYSSGRILCRALPPHRLHPDGDRRGAARDRRKRGALRSVCRSAPAGAPGSVAPRLGTRALRRGAGRRADS